MSKIIPNNQGETITALEQYGDAVKWVDVWTAPDACEARKAHAGTKYSLEKRRSCQFLVALTKKVAAVVISHYQI